MNKVFVLALFISLFSCEQEIDCRKFKEGHFLIKPDSLPNRYYFNVYRDNNEQLEIDQNGKRTVVYVKWVSDCSYEVRSIPDKGNDFKSLNDSSVVRVELYKTISDTAFYRTYVFTTRGILPATSGKMIRL